MYKFFDGKGFRIFIGILIILVIIIISSNDSKSSITLIENKEDFNEVLKEDDVVIIDVRNADEYEESHIPKAINIPYNELQTKVHYDKNKKIIVYSYNDSRSHLAAVVLEKMEYKNVYEGDMSKYNGKLVTK